MSSKDKDKGKDKQSKNLKKLNNFFDKNASLSKRFKSLISYIERASPEELNKFFNENFYMIYGVFLDTFSAVEGNCKKGKHSQTDVTDLLIVLKNVLLYLQELVRKRWQIRSIAGVLEKVLYKENKASIRVTGFELLLFFLEALQSPEEPQTELLGCAIDFAPFITGSVSFRFQTLSAPEKTAILVPSQHGAQTVENSVKLLEILLDYMGTRTETFSFWWNLFKQKFITVFYPDISKELGLLDDDTGFRPYCPWQIQSVLIPRLELWMKNPEIVKLLWSNEENTKIMLEIYRQSCFLPISCDATIRKSFGIFRSLFMDNPIPEVKEKLTEYRKFFLQKLSIIFTTETPPQNAQQSVYAHVALCLEILQFFKYLFQEAFDTLEIETQEVLLYTLLDTTTALLKEGTPNPALAENLASVMMDTILYIWIRTKTRKEQLWKALQDGISGLFHAMEPVVQTKIKVLQLTLVVKDLIYPVKEKKKKVVKVAKEGDETPGPPKKPEAAMPKCPDTLPPLQEIKRDPAVTDGMNWTVDEIKFAWTQMLLIFSKVNSINDPNIHAEAISCITEVVQILMNAETSVPYQETLDESRPQPLSLINIFGPWLFECCAIPSDSHIKGKADAYGTLCRLIVRKHTHTLPLKLLSHFYGIIHRGLLTSSNTIVSWAILTNANNIFNLALPGANILIPYFLREAKCVLGPSANPTPPAQVKLKSIMILCSLLCYPNHLSGVSMPVEDTQIGGPKEIKFPDLKKQLYQLLLDTANSDPVPDHKISCIWGICVYVLEELFHVPGLPINDAVKALLGFCTHSDYSVARAALDSLSCISYSYKTLKEVDETVIEHVVETLCNNIIKTIVDSQINRSFGVKENIIADHFYCLLDWFMYGHPAYIFDKPEIANKVCQAIELGLVGQKALSVLPTAQAPEKEVSKSKDKSKDKKKRMSVRETPEKQDSKKATTTADDDDSAPRLNPSHGSVIICEAAEILWMHLLSFLQNFPSKEGIDIHSSLVTEQDDNMEHDPSTTYYVFNDCLLFSLLQVPHPSGGTAARIILRDQTGKYAWDSLLTYDNPNNKLIEPAAPLFRDSNVPEVYVAPPDPELSKLPLYSREYRQKPKFSAEVNLSTVDQLDQLLEYLSETSPDCLIFPELKQNLNIPAPSLPEYGPRVKVTQAALLEQASEDQQVVVAKKANKPQSEYWMIKPPDPPTPNSQSHFCRMLLNHLGFLVFDRRDCFAELENSPRFLRSLAQLDKTMGREMLKIGVIYVAHGQDDQKIILQNETKTALYKEFVRGLGWNIDIANHRGYLGGLDPKLTTGTHSPYFANSIMEVIFHDITAMPTNPADPQQIHKKRHVGNDIVHIVYSEHASDYSPQTITSHFNDAHIVVYPLPNGLFRIQVYRKENVHLFGPLIHGMCINKKLLPILVRQTAINANRYVRYNTEGYTRPYPTRRRALDEIVKRYKIQKRYEDIISEITSPTPPPPAATTNTAAVPAGASS
eukprot:TRINITY_DN516_c0_g1_i1.p1 TRINITY_DN516_c0_g1~~TRINITY_DN516_c0_g1_i1.p1  ORF type:complete len:1485 (+),score=330.88 TRINITY_DN516_c0_g1_i1:382-4836(+)